MKLQAKVKLGNKLKSIKIKIGILGGTFDPAHKGHLQISKQAKKRFDLKNIIWAITKKNPFKNESKLNLKQRIHFAKKLIDNRQSTGFKSIQWDATNNYGKKVSAGVYLYSIQAGDFRQTKKMVLLK